jgi:hypothetical protein
MNFGNYAILDDVKHVFEKEPGWWWMIRPPSTRDELQVTRLLATDQTRREADGTVSNLQVTTLDVAIREIAVTFGGTNIPMSETDPTPILKKGALLGEIEDALKEMPRAMILELWTAVGKAVPGWGPVQPAGETKN